MRSAPGRAPAGAAGDGFRDGLTVVTAYVPFGLALGAALASSGVGSAAAWSSSFLVFAGAAQLVSVQLLGHGATVVAVVLTALVVNSRHLLYSASLAPHMQGWDRRQRGVAAYFLADPVYALAIARFQSRDDGDRGRLGYYLAAGVTCWAGWLALTGTGALLAGALPASLPLQLAAPLTFLLLLVPTIKDHAGYAAAAVAALVAVPSAHLPLGLGLLPAAAAGVAAGVVVERIHRA